MPLPLGQQHIWKTAMVSLALLANGIGGFLVLIWAVVAGLWTFGSEDYVEFAGIVLAAAILISAPIIGVRAVVAGRRGLAAVATGVPLLFYLVLIFAVSG